MRGISTQLKGHHSHNREVQSGFGLKLTKSKLFVAMKNGTRPSLNDTYSRFKILDSSHTPLY